MIISYKFKRYLIHLKLFLTFKWHLHKINKMIDSIKVTNVESFHLLKKMKELEK